MTLEEIENDKVVRICYDHLDKFTEIYPKDGTQDENPIPKEGRITVYCNGSMGDGFVINTTYDEMGLEMFIAKKWILHSELEKLAGRELKDFE